MTDPWKLLRKAREELGTIEALTLHPKFHNGEGGDELTNFLAKIDEALKEHDRNIGWIQEGQYADYCGEYGSGFIVPRRMELEHRFFWRIFRQNKRSQYDEGYTETFEEAKEQATESLRRKVYG